MSVLIRIFITLLLMANTSMAGIFNAQTKTLSNGLQIIVIPNTLSPSVSVGMLYKVGTADDPPSMMGLSHFLEHMMFKGTKSVPGDGYNKIISRIGGMHNAMTHFDYTIYVAEVASQHLELMIQMEADRMVNLTFAQHEVDTERQVVWEERRMRLENHPFGQAYELLYRSLNPYHPYGTLPIGYPHHIKAYSFEALHQHYKTWYAPNNAVLIVVGNTTLEEVTKLAEKHLESIPSKEIPKRERPQNPPIKDITTHIEQKNPRNSNILLNWFYNAPTISQNKKQYYALNVLSVVLGGSISNFYRHFVEDQKLCLNVSADYDGVSLDPQHFSISATLAPNMDVNAFKAELKKWLRDVIEKGVSAEEIQKAKTRLIAQVAFLKDGNMQTMENFVGLAMGETLEDFESYADGIKAVAEGEVHQAAKDILGQMPCVTMDLYPEG